MEAAQAVSAQMGVIQATSEPERIRALDVLRGFAILGILYMNVQDFSMPFSAYINPSVYGDLHGANFAVWFFGRVFIDQKFMTIFSLLFGAGVLLFTGRVEARGIKPARLHFRRMGWLTLIGLMHGFLLWSGDILFSYGMCGMIVYRARRWPARRLLIVGIGLLTFGSAFGFVARWSMPHAPTDIQEFAREGWNPPRYVIADDLAAYRGGWRAQERQRAVEMFFGSTMVMLLYTLWRVVGLMLAGMALFKLEVITGRRPATTYWKMAAVGLGLGVPVSVVGAWLDVKSDFSYGYANLYGPQFNYWGSLIVAVGWIGLVLLAAKRSERAAWLRRLSATGQMAFTNYLMQTVLCTTLFYGHGLGWYGHVERVYQLAIAIGVCGMELAWSPVWLRHFRFGPFEWLWRSLTYRQAQPMRRQAPRAIIGASPA
jgi:uncharacterized protein